jgi:hypothetical protein
MVIVFELRRLVTLTAIIACVSGVAAQAPTPALTALPSHEQRVATDGIKATETHCQLTRSNSFTKKSTNARMRGDTNFLEGYTA